MSSENKLPSVTSILDYFGNSEALLNWANGLGLKGKKYSDESQYHKNVGTLTHKKIELYLLAEDKASFQLVQDINALEKDYKKDVIFSSSIAFQSFKKCYNEQEFIRNMEVVLQEKKFSSEKLGFCGILDFLGSYNNDYYLLDYKTSSKIRPFYFLQLAAYSLLLEENGYLTTKHTILRLDKGNIKYEVKTIDDISRYKRIFKMMTKMYRILNKFEKEFGV